MGQLTLIGYNITKIRTVARTYDRKAQGLILSGSPQISSLHGPEECPMQADGRRRKIGACTPLAGHYPIATVRPSDADVEEVTEWAFEMSESSGLQRLGCH